MSEMIERVARAIYDTDHFSGPAYDSEREPYKETFRVQARAAIEAMRPATAAMHRAAWNACERGNHALEPNAGWAEYNGRVFTAMIDAALSERQP